MSVRTTRVSSPIGKVNTDKEGSAVAVLKIDPQKAYCGTPALLQKYINESDEASWQVIKAKIDYMYDNLDQALGALDKITGYSADIKAQVKAGKKLLFKPNLVGAMNIDPVTHGETLASNTCTEWPFIAALMRWFHDKLDITYHQMSLGEAASAMSIAAGTISNNFFNRQPYPTTAVMEGKSGDFHGGWGFYFVRKYLAETHLASHKDNPMNGYYESIAGIYIPPGKVKNKLMLYDLNRLYDDPGKGREVLVPGGRNYKGVTLHKAVIGGDPDDKEDMKLYPGCILINVPRLKLHVIDLITNAIKNLGIGLYPQEAPVNEEKGCTMWKYAFPPALCNGMKTEIPHQVWVPEQEEDSPIPLRDKNGKYIVNRTDGIAGTQADIMRAVQAQNIYMLHIVDAIESVNISHQGGGVRVPEGLVIAGKDAVAVDVFSARYCFKTVLMSEARELQAKNNYPGDFFRKVPVVEVEGGNLVTKQGYDSPLWRYGLYEYVEKRGVGSRKYYVTGRDITTDSALSSVQGHFGRLDGNEFKEMITSTLYYAAMCFLWDMEKTALSYAEANDRLTGSTYHKMLLDAFDENGDGVISYEETGKKGFFHAVMREGSQTMSLGVAHPESALRNNFLSRGRMAKNSNRQWNTSAHDYAMEFMTAQAISLAFMVSQAPVEMDDPNVPGLKFGNGKWPSLQFAQYGLIASFIFGINYPFKLDLMSLYGMAFQYADKSLTGPGPRYTGQGLVLRGSGTADLEAANNYLKDVAEGKKPLDFTVFVPPGYNRLMFGTVPNVQETRDPDKMFTAEFNEGREVWKD